MYRLFVAASATPAPVHLTSPACLRLRQDPPDLDLTLLEGNHQMVLDMRTQMIRRNANSVTMAQTLVLPDGHSVEVPNLNISYRAIANTTLR